MIDTLFAVGNVIALIGTAFLIVEVYKNKEVLKGHSLVGALLTFLSLICFTPAFILMKNWIAVGTIIPTALYWLLVVIYLKLEEMKE